MANGFLQGEIEYDQQLWLYQRPVAQKTMGNSTKYQDYVLLGWKKSCGKSSWY